MVTRLPFSTDTCRAIDAHIQERLPEIEENFASEAYPRDKPRKILIELSFEPDKEDPSSIDCKIFSQVKLPKRYGKKVPAVIRDGKILVEEGPQETSIFGENVTSLRKEAVE